MAVINGKIELGTWSLGGFLKEMLFEKMEGIMRQCKECKHASGMAPFLDGRQYLCDRTVQGVGGDKGIVWPDCSCPDWVAKTGWGERAAKRIAERIQEEGLAALGETGEWPRGAMIMRGFGDLARIIQEEMEKGE